MKINRILSTALLAISVTVAINAAAPLKSVAGKDLTLIGKLRPTPDRYARVDTLTYGGFTDYQRRDLNQGPAGLALTFKTDSRNIKGKINYKDLKHGYNSTDVSYAGLDLYIKKDGKWLYAGSSAMRGGSDVIELVANMAPGEKECLLYLPMRSIVDEVYVLIDSTANIQPIENPFQRKVVFFGSSYTHGTSCSRPGMSYPAQFQRATGYDVCALGVAGNSKLQQSYARLLADTDAEAFVFDAFSNPSAKEIRERFADFVKTIREKHPTTPLIFQHTIYRGGRNFDTRVDKAEREKHEAAEEVVRKAMETDPNIYLISPVADNDGYSSTDKIHPSDLGYYNWMQSIRVPVIEILSKYGINPQY
ncbi:MAG: SGNH/GDSL hydrolase family protein [Clostridium sp.]|nr:SGNH/GDSL hydrolase family protein [Clostridium sp.]